MKFIKKAMIETETKFTMGALEFSYFATTCFTAIGKIVKVQAENRRCLERCRFWYFVT